MAFNQFLTTTKQETFPPYVSIFSLILVILAQLQQPFADIDLNWMKVRVFRLPLLCTFPLEKTVCVSVSVREREREREREK